MPKTKAKTIQNEPFILTFERNNNTKNRNESGTKWTSILTFGKKQ